MTNNKKKKANKSNKETNKTASDHREDRDVNAPNEQQAQTNNPGGYSNDASDRMQTRSQTTKQAQTTRSGDDLEDHERIDTQSQSAKGADDRSANNADNGAKGSTSPAPGRETPSRRSNNSSAPRDAQESSSTSLNERNRAALYSEEEVENDFDEEELEDLRQEIIEYQRKAAELKREARRISSRVKGTPLDTGRRTPMDDEANASRRVPLSEEMRQATSGEQHSQRPTRPIYHPRQRRDSESTVGYNRRTIEQDRQRRHQFDDELSGNGSHGIDREVEELEEERREAAKEAKKKKSKDARMANYEGESPSMNSENELEKYLEWLQNEDILDRIRDQDLDEFGESYIPPRRKRNGYKGKIPKEAGHLGEFPDNVAKPIEYFASRRNATPGPSRPNKDQTPGNTGGGGGKKPPPKGRGGYPSSSDSSSSSDDTYKPSKASESDTSESPSDSTRGSKDRREGLRRKRSMKRKESKTKQKKRLRKEERRRKTRKARPNPSDSSGSSSPSEPSSSEETDETDERRKKRKRNRDAKERHKRRRRESREDEEEEVDARHRTPARYPSSQPTQTISTNTGIEGRLEYENAYIRKIKDLIYDRVGKRRVYAYEMKGVKVHAPDHYDGKDDVEKFFEWLSGLLRWLRVNNICGRQADQQRVDLTGTTLKEQASEWFAAEVEGFQRRTREWTFEEVIVEMYKRFIHEVTAQNASERFERARYSRSRGALSFLNELEKHAGRMVEPPNEYTFRKTFLKGLPHDLVEKLFLSRHISAEHTPLDRIVEEVKAMESSMTAVELHSNNRSSERPTPRRSDGKFRSSGRIVRFKRRDRPSTGKPTSSGDRDKTYDRGNRPSGSKTRSDFKKTGYKSSRDYRGPSKSKEYGRNNSRNTSSIDKSNIECFKCHKKGHYANECPDDGPQHFGMREIINEDEEDKSPNNGDKSESEEASDQEGDKDHRESDDDNLEGSQYEPEGDDHSDGSEYDEYVVFSDTPDTDDDNDRDIVYHRATRVVERQPPRRVPPLPYEMDGETLIRNMSFEMRFTLWTDRVMKGENRGDWIPPEPSPMHGQPYYPEARLHLMGYTWEDHEKDREYLCDISRISLELFEIYTGYSLPECDCAECGGQCDFHITETVQREDDGVRFYYQRICEHRGRNQVLRGQTPGSRTMIIPNSVDTELYEPDMSDVQLMIGHLDTNKRREIYRRRKIENDARWKPIPFDESDQNTWWKPPPGISDLGYNEFDEDDDIEWLWDLTWEDPKLFTELTGRDCPVRPHCHKCNECRPLMIHQWHLDNDGKEWCESLLHCAKGEGHWAMPITETLFAVRDRAPDTNTRAYRSYIRKPIGTAKRKKQNAPCLTAYVEYNGVKAYTLFDSGSTTDFVSPDFTRVAKLNILELENPITLQLGCVGSRSQINYGTKHTLQLGSIKVEHYLDVCNIDKYDIVLGTEFLEQFHICLDFSTREIVMRDGNRIHGLPEGEGLAVAAPKRPRASQNN